MAVEASSIPPAWWEDDRMTLTLLDVMEDRAERMKRNSRGR